MPDSRSMKLVRSSASVDPAAALEEMLWDGDVVRPDVLESLSACIPGDFRLEFVHEMQSMIHDLEPKLNRRAIASAVLFETYGDDYEMEGAQLPFLAGLHARRGSLGRVPEPLSKAGEPHRPDQSTSEQIGAICAKVADRIGATRFKTWFGSAEVFQLDGHRLEVTVPNALIGNWVASHLVEATREVVGQQTRVEIRAWEHESAVSQGRAEGSGVVPEAEPPPALRKPEVPRLLRGELQSFVVGPSNELAYKTALSIVHDRGQVVRPLVVHGGCGVGKTHLLQGICNGVWHAHPALDCRYITGEEFTNEFVYAVRAGQVDAFRRHFRHIDLLVIDDIHLLVNKKATQEEFLHTFNAIDACGKSVVLSSDRHPGSIATLSEPLRSRLIAGMVVELSPPDFSTRREILRQRASAFQVTIPDDVLDYVATCITQNVRELEGALYKLVALTSLARSEMSLELARKATEDYHAAIPELDAGRIERLCAAYFGVTTVALRSTMRNRSVSLARSLTMFLVRKHTRLSFPEIENYFGSNHSTVMMAVRRVQMLLETDATISWRTQAGVQSDAARKVINALEDALPIKTEHASMVTAAGTSETCSGTTAAAADDDTSLATEQSVRKRIAEIKRRIAEGNYLTPEKLDVIADALCREISATHVEKHRASERSA